MRLWPHSVTSPSRRPLRTFLVAGAVLVIVGTSVVVTGSHLKATSARESGVRRSHAGAPAKAAAALTRGLPQGPGTARKILTLASADNLPADCLPQPSGPPASTYQLGIVGTVHGGVLDAGTATVNNINVMFCGVVTVVNGTPPCGATGSVSSPPDGQVFSPLSVAFTLVPGMSPSVGFTANPGTITGTFSCDDDPAGLHVTLIATVSGTTAALFGVQCTIGPVTIPLTGTVTGPFTDLTATLTSTSFSVPTVQSSPTCPAGVPANVDAVVGLPIAPGGASATLPITASLYQPVQ
jgi:hypothetical protein